MNAVFWLLVIIALIVVWFCASGIFTTIGGFVQRIVKDAADIITKREDNNE